MLIKTTDLIKTYEGKEIHINKELEPLTVGMALIEALNYHTSDNRPTAEQSIRAWMISQKIIEEGQVEIKSEDVVFIKERLLLIFSPMVFGPVVALLEGETDK